MKTIYKLTSFAVIFLLFASPVLKAEEVTYKDSWGPSGISLVQSDQGQARVNFSLTNFQLTTLEMDGSESMVIQVPGIMLPNTEGAPNLPGTGRYIAIPNGAVPQLNVLSFRKEIIEDIDIAPAPIIPKDTEDGPLTYDKDMSIYGENAYYPADPFKISSVHQIRGINVVTLGITPFQYNPVTRELIIYRDVEVEVIYNGGTQFGDDRLRSRWWDPIIRDAVLNSDIIPDIDYAKKYASIDQTKNTDYEYVIIVPDDPVFIAWADSLKQWRTLQGIRTGVFTTTDVGGNTTSAIESWVNNAYNNWTIPPAAVLLMADYGSSGSTIISPIWSNYCASDNIYADVDNDDLPDIVFARMTAQNATHLETMVKKVLNNERTPPTNPGYYDNPITACGWQTQRWFQICSEAVGGYWKHIMGKNPTRINAIYSGTPGSSWSSNQNTYMVTDYFGPNGLGYIPATPAELGGWTGGNATMVNNAINSGAFMMQHRDHGGTTGWGEPDYQSSDIDGLMNTDLTWVFSINCLTGKYNMSGECFTEKFHRYNYNGQPSGALGVTAASEVSYSFVNDTYVWGMMDNMWTDFMPDYGTTPPSRDVLPAFGNAAGKHFLQQSSWPYNPQHKDYTHHLFHHHGDAFMTVYANMPQNLTVLHDPVLLSGVQTYTVTANDGSFIALTVNGQIIGTAEGTGSPVNISIPAQTPGDVMLVTVTKQDYFRYESEVNIIPPSGPYVAYESHVVDDAAGGNGNNIPEYGEDILLDMTLENLGSTTANNVNATLISSDPNIVITDNSNNWAAIPAGSTSTETGAFAISINDVIPDQHTVLFELQVNGAGDDTWTSYFTITLSAPVIELGNLTVDDAVGGDGNGRLDPGETADLIIENLNTGSSPTPFANTTLASTNTYITVNTGASAVGVIPAGGSADAVFNVSVDASTPIGEVVDFIYDLTAGAYVENHTFYNSVGLILEDWETGDFSSFLWGFDGASDWFIDDQNPYEGTYCAKSGPIDDDQTSELMVQVDVATASTISFFRKVSSESGDDFLAFYIDGALQEQWSGEVAWSEVSYNVDAGVHQFKWVYQKDGYTSSGSDCAWIDYIIFPPLGAEIPQMSVSTDSLDFENVFVGDLYTKTFTITNDGTGLLTGDMITPVDEFVVGCEGGKNTYTYEVLPGFTTEFQVTFGPTAIQSYSGDMVITNNVSGLGDQIIYLTGAGINGLSIPYDQDFEEGGNWPYAWNNTTGDDFDWELNTGSTPSTGTGPSGDHTTGSGYYIYTEASSPNYPNKVAIMETPVFDLATATNPAMTFYYHMLGDDMGELHIDVLSGGTWTNDFVAPITGDQGDQWNLMVVDLSTLSGTVKFRLRGITGDGYESDMAIDDFSMIDNTGTPGIAVNPTSLDFQSVFVGGTHTLQFTIENTASGTLSGDITTPAGYTVAEVSDITGGKGSIQVNSDNTITYNVPFMMTIPFDVTFAPTAAQNYDGNITITSNDPGNPTVDLPVYGEGVTGLPIPYDTDFEEGGVLPYAWENATSGDDFDWELNTGSTGSSGTGPSGDHTTGSGYYVYTESSTPNYPSKVAILETPVFDLNGVSNATLIFWYHMYGSSMGELHLDAYSGGAWTNDVMTPVIGDQGNQWLMMVVDLSSFTNTLKLRFRGITGTSYTSDMAIDDFSIIDNSGTPSLNVDPVSLDFDSVWVNNTATLQFTIENTGNGTLSGDITTPAGYSITEVASEFGIGKLMNNYAENTITYSVPFMTTDHFEVTFEPTASQNYDDIITITSNDPNNATFDLPVYGAGVNPPDISASPTSYSVILPPDGTTMKSLTIENNGEATLDYDIVTYDTDNKGGKMEGYFSEELLEAVAAKPDLANQTDELDNNTSSEEQLVLPGIKKFGDKGTDLEEIFGSWYDTYSGSNRDRGNIFHVTTSVMLNETRFYLNIPTSTQLYFFVYEGTSMTGTFTKVAENHIPSSGTGEGWYSSGTMIVNLDAGKYYYIGTAWQGSATYGRGNESVPLPCSFGTLETGIPGTMAGYPPAQTCSTTYSGFSPYYQTIVTGPVFTWLNPNPTTGNVQGNNSTVVDLGFDATGLTEGVYTKDLVINSNDPDQPTVTIPVTLTVTNYGVILDATIMMEGPYDGTGISTTLNSTGFIPLNQPFNTSPWNYNGTESVAAMPNGDVADWVLVELRDAPDASSATGSTMIDRQAAFVLNDGSIVGMDGSGTIGFTPDVAQNLFVVVWHRNHLGIMSGQPVQATSGIYTYDFSTSDSQSYGGNTAVKELAPGVWGMISGDANADGQVSNADKNDAWYPQSGLSGYLSSDYNFDSQVENMDKNIYWAPNTGSGGQVPDYAKDGYKCQVPK